MRASIGWEGGGVTVANGIQFRVHGAVVGVRWFTSSAPKNRSLNLHISLSYKIEMQLQPMHRHCRTYPRRVFPRRACTDSFLAGSMKTLSYSKMRGA